MQQSESVKHIHMSSHGKFLEVLFEILWRKPISVTGIKNNITNICKNSYLLFTITARYYRIFLSQQNDNKNQNTLVPVMCCISPKLSVCVFLMSPAFAPHHGGEDWKALVNLLLCPCLVSKCLRILYMVNLSKIF